MALGKYGIQNIVNLNARDAVKIPDHMTPEDSAVAALAFPVALYALQNLADLKNKQPLLVAGAESTIGLAAVQVALLKGAEVRTYSHIMTLC